jgi:nucleoside-diphosphate-sugar epimerase
MSDPGRILVTGGAGYVGSVTVPKLLDAGHAVTVLDTYWYGARALDRVRDHRHLTEIRGDIRDRAVVDEAMAGCDTVIHLACISNDPSYELDPELGRSINYDAFFGLVDSALEHGVNRFVYASTSSVYGIKEEDRVTEDLPLEPLTDYSKYKAACEEVLFDRARGRMCAVVLRPATVCGYGPRLRLDLTVNILTNLAYHDRRITVFGGEQRRPNIHIDDVSDLYVAAMGWPDEKIDGQVFNAGYENHRVREIAELVRGEIGDDVEIVTTPTDDHRSYHISSKKIDRALGYRPKRTIEDAVRSLVGAFDAGLVPDSRSDPRWFNIKMMEQLKVSAAAP